MHSPQHSGHVPRQPSVPADVLHRVLYRMAERATVGLPLYEFLQTVHQLLGELLYARNFYVCLVNEAQRTLDFPYYVDERDGDTMQCNAVPMRKGLTEFVLRTNRPQLIDAQRFILLQQQGEVTEATGDLSFSAWLGVPMPLRGEVGGVLVVQRYDEGTGYTAADADVLSFVANQFGSVLERHQAIDALKQSEARYRAVFEHLSAGVVVLQHGQTVFANPAMAQMVGRSAAELLVAPLAACLHPDDASWVDAWQADRTALAPAPLADVRVVTATGEFRHLEVSGAHIEWNARPATLLFAVDATARLQAEFARRDALSRERELNDLKARFISMASHEFRTPLSAISSSVDLLMHYESDLARDEKKECLQRIHHAVARMTLMLENVLLTGRAEAGPLPFCPAPLHISPFCRGVTKEVQDAMGQRDPQVDITLDLPPDSVCLLLDEALLRHVVVNLMTNAVKYSPSGGQVRLSVSLAQGLVWFRVADEGIGIEPGDMPRLFERFYRGRNVGHVAGTGLGLSIVLQAVTAHGGGVQAKPNQPQGTVFEVIVPAVPVA